MHQRTEATGMLMLERITPVITALFGGYVQQATACQNGIIIKLWEDMPPSWRDVHRALVQLSKTLDMPIPLNAMSTIQGQLDWFAWFLRNEESGDLQALLREHRFEGMADIETLFLLSDILNDGHGLFAIRFEGLLPRGIPALLQPRRPQRLHQAADQQTDAPSRSNLPNWLRPKGKPATHFWANWVNTLLPH
jgi:hypothetical protein